MTKGRSAGIFEPTDMVVVDSQTLRGYQTGEQPRKFFTRWPEPLAIRSRGSALGYIDDLAGAWICHNAVNIGFLKKLKELAGLL